MAIPFEALIPYGIILAMFGVSGAGLNKLRHWQNGNKRARRSLDQWDRQSTNILEAPDEGAGRKANRAMLVVMDRDRRLTGLLRGQSDTPIAPAGFELNNPWRVEKRFS